MSKTFSSNDVNAILDLVGSLSHDNNCRLTMLAFATALACRSLGVSKEYMLEMLSELFDSDVVVEALDDRDDSDINSGLH